MKRGIRFICFSIILILCISFISAGFFSDLWNKITGRATDIICTDSDGSLGFPGYYSVKGHASLSTDEYKEDYCVSNTYLKEAACSGSSLVYKSYVCSVKCENGACKDCTIYYYDSDGDGYGTSTTKCLITATGNYRATNTGDCNDNDANINPSKTELCSDNIDNDCDGSIDEGCEIPSETIPETTQGETLETEIQTIPSTLPTIGPNTKSNIYSNKEIFLVSDKDWKVVLPFISVAIWTEGNIVYKYPFLIYHEEDTGFDADSIIYFMQQYNPDRVTIIENIPENLYNALIEEGNNGGGISPNNIQRVESKDFLSYWSAVNKIVYVENNYDLALLASTYASLINSPLIIQGTHNDVTEIFSGRNIICIGNVASIASGCSETYNLEQLQQKYFDKTNTDKIILINPNDWTNSVYNRFYHDNGGDLFELYAKTSINAPILASAKHELILITHDMEYLSIDGFLEQKINAFNPNYLTIIAASNVIPHKRGGEEGGVQLDFSIAGIDINFDSSDFGIAIDPHDYADVDGDNLPDVAVGRIAGLSNSDVSSYIARVLVYNEFQKTNNMKFFGSAFQGILASMVMNIAKEFENAGYNSVAVTSEEELYEFNPSEWENQDLILYTGHGSSFWAGIYYNEIPKLTNSFIVTPTCATIEDFNDNSFWAHSIRNGAIGYAGASTPTFLTTNLLNLLNNIYYSGQDLGNAFKNSYRGTLFQGMIMLIGDPTLSISPPQTISAKSTTQPLLREIPDSILEIAQSFLDSLMCENTQTSCGMQPNCVDCTALPPEDLICNAVKTKVMGKYYICFGNAIGCKTQLSREVIETCSNGCSETGGEAHCKKCTNPEDGINCGSTPADTTGCGVYEKWVKSHKGKGCDANAGDCYDNGWNDKVTTPCTNICRNGECTCDVTGTLCLVDRACCAGLKCAAMRCKDCIGEGTVVYTITTDASKHRSNCCNGYYCSDQRPWICREQRCI